MTDRQQPSIFIGSDQGSIFRRSFPEKKVFQLTGRKITRPDRRLDDGDDEDDGQGDQHQVQGRKHGGPKNEVNTEKMFSGFGIDRDFQRRPPKTVK